MKKRFFKVKSIKHIVFYINKLFLLLNLEEYNINNDRNQFLADYNNILKRKIILIKIKSKIIYIRVKKTQLSEFSKK